ncbi:MAG: RNA polymerase sigma factor, partial [Bacteroidota bacterium]
QTLLQEEQAFIFNISQKMLLNPEDAKDATQEILIKIITHLKGFKGKSSFRTWIYRITVNHLLNIKKKATEQMMEQISQYPPARLEQKLMAEAGEEYPQELIEEVRLLCSTAMLMCLDRRQRLLYILGEVFEIDHRLGAEIFETSPGNYRVLLSRARQQLQNHMMGKCGIVNPENPCRCPKKTQEFVKKGIVQADQLRFNTHFEKKIKDLIQSEEYLEMARDIRYRHKEMFQSHPFQTYQEVDNLLKNLISE